MGAKAFITVFDVIFTAKFLPSQIFTVTPVRVSKVFVKKN
jgi:hypothetical protein